MDYLEQFSKADENVNELATYLEQGEVDPYEAAQKWMDAEREVRTLDHWCGAKPHNADEFSDEMTERLATAERKLYNTNQEIEDSIYGARKEIDSSYIEQAVFSDNTTKSHINLRDLEKEKEQDLTAEAALYHLDKLDELVETYNTVLDEYEDGDISWNDASTHLNMAEFDDIAKQVGEHYTKLPSVFGRRNTTPLDTNLVEVDHKKTEINPKDFELRKRLSEFYAEQTQETRRYGQRQLNSRIPAR